MLRYARPLAELIEQLETLPGIGPKSAQRVAFHLLRAPQQTAQRLAQSVLRAKELTRDCGQCFNYSEGELCPLCADPQRDRAAICVVPEPRDLMAVENAGGFRGAYHVLQGLISPLDGVGPDDLRIDELLARLERESVSEVVLAISPTVEGDTTAMYLARVLKPTGVRVTRLALGLPVGGDLDYADQVTIVRALEGRTEL
ncbi:MAG: recombination protein RecR [Armatimonadetes bacterium CG_4_10_14_3_um_filter_66_18]|nr:recombination protein RecR [Armatimonadota bacterium]OIP03214.1 MAG: recombination protein RecR [Armatimonadetes bacterium CG2_30_66_41]PIU90293.1 MAG: recombination protein RecR [Armatimonadetes bacterium CG06_land_8_20_14_3_00_66_21]PIX45687.1 MAG: recombination protein RecR [Armatimonadetes bacterium CG_4_8_14_3_um_filter_66_20]PIY43327.1 MAG: recombination protein RecR [Armatimonadetes bacterium CG_4_10_14_3_um_filter_66_18]PIZ31087.1 MAG: recombination protein RecR [Armatimonadetes bac